jgi:hypothetical protein
MPPFGPISRRELIEVLKRAGFSLGKPFALLSCSAQAQMTVE